MNVAVVQARMGSTRFPGKVLMDLGGRPVLDHVLTRVHAIAGIDRVCCAIPDGPAQQPLAALAQSLGAVVVAGPEHDVLTRYLKAARHCDAEVVMRITSDCPLLDPSVSGRVLGAFLEGGADYVSNVDPRSWPKGLDTEVFSRRVLEQAAAVATDPYDREHVTPWIRRAPGGRNRAVVLGRPGFADWRWTLDYEADLKFMSEVISALPDQGDRLATFDDIRTLVERSPQIAAINSHLA